MTLMVSVPASSFLMECVAAQVPPVQMSMIVDSRFGSTDSSVLCVPCKLATGSRDVTGFQFDLIGKTTAVPSLVGRCTRPTCHSQGNKKSQTVLGYMNSLGCHRQ